MIIAIVAMANNRAIGKDNQLLWHLPDDLKRFKALTVGQTVIMGRKTYESIGRALPNRTNIILSKDKAFHADNCIITHSIDEALKAARSTAEICIIGGEKIYAQFLPLISRIYLTQVEKSFDGDAFFPKLEASEWIETENILHPIDAKHPLPFRYITLDRVR